MMKMLMRLTRLHMRYMRQELEALGLYPGQPQLLMALREHENASQRELAKILEVSPATLTVMLRRMDSKQLIERLNDPQDMRLTRLRLTQGGREKLAQIDDIVKHAGKQLDGLFSKQELDIARQMMERVCERLFDVPQPRDE